MSSKGNQSRSFLQNVGVIFGIGLIFLMLEVITPGSVTGPIERVTSGIWNFLDALFTLVFFLLIIYVLVGFFYWMYKRIQK